MNPTTPTALREAFADEARTAARYLSFAELAEIEGHAEVATLFRELARTAVLHAHGHLDWLRLAADPATDLPIGTTAENLRSALAGEAAEAAATYPQRARAAAEDGLTDLASWFDCLATYKRAHLGRLGAALEAVIGRAA